MNGVKTGRVKFLMAHFLLLDYQDMPWGWVTKITPPDTEGIESMLEVQLIPCPTLHGLRCRYLLFSARQDNFALYSHCHKKSKFECWGKREEKNYNVLKLFLHYSTITIPKEAIL